MTRRPRVVPGPDWPQLPIGVDDPPPATTGSDRAAWIADTVDRIRQVGTVRLLLSADDVRPGLQPPASPYWPGAAWAMAARHRIICRSGGHRRSTARSRRHGTITVWRSLVYRPTDGDL